MNRIEYANYICPKCARSISVSGSYASVVYVCLEDGCHLELNQKYIVLGGELEK